MPRVINTAAVVDVDRWLTAKAERAELFGALGGRNVTDYVAFDGSNNVAVSYDAEDLDHLNQPPSTELLALAERIGVIPPAKVYVEK